MAASNELDLNCIAGFYPPTAGNVQFKGEDITGLPADEICLRGIARTFQIVRVFKDMSVLDNVMVGAFNRTNSAARAKQKALEVLDFCGLAPKKSMLAGGLTIAEAAKMGSGNCNKVLTAYPGYATKSPWLEDQEFIFAVPSTM